MAGPALAADADPDRSVEQNRPPHLMPGADLSIGHRGPAGSDIGGVEVDEYPAGDASIARFNRCAVPGSVSPGTGDCVTCNATSGSAGEVTCTRAEPGPETTRCVDQSAGIVSATRPSTRSVVGGLCRVVAPWRTTAAGASNAKATPAAATRASVGTRERVAGRAAGSAGSSEGGRAALANRASRTPSISTTLLPVPRTAPAIAAASAAAPATVLGTSISTTAVIPRVIRAMTLPTWPATDSASVRRATAATRRRPPTPVAPRSPPPPLRPKPPRTPASAATTAGARRHRGSACVRLR